MPDDVTSEDDQYEQVGDDVYVTVAVMFIVMLSVTVMLTVVVTL